MPEPHLLPSDDGLEVLHTRTYETRTYIKNEETMLVRGAISDMKPPGLYVADDPEELQIHQMQVELEVRIADLTITAVRVGFDTHPHESCPGIISTYEKLVGLSVARGFTHKVRELLGGPRGCSHTTALIQAMAPAIVQSIWSVNMRKARMSDAPSEQFAGKRREQAMAGNLNTCHVWDENGEQVAKLRSGNLDSSTPLPMRDRLVKLGRNPDDWNKLD